MKSAQKYSNTFVPFRFRATKESRMKEDELIVAPRDTVVTFVDISITTRFTAAWHPMDKLLSTKQAAHTLRDGWCTPRCSRRSKTREEKTERFAIRDRMLDRDLFRGTNHRWSVKGVSIISQMGKFNTFIHLWKSVETRLCVRGKYAVGYLYAAPVFDLISVFSIRFVCFFPPLFYILRITNCVERIVTN